MNNKESVANVARDLDLNTKTLYLWVRTYKKEHNISATNTKLSTSGETVEDELKRLLLECFYEGFFMSKFRVDKLLQFTS